MSKPRERHPHYILQGKLAVPASLMEWAMWLDTCKDRHVAEDQIGDRWVSTVFMGLDHNFFGDGPPLLFETMIFGGDADEEYGQWRYSTWEEAAAGHAEVCAQVREDVRRRTEEGRDLLKTNTTEEKP